MPSYHSVIYRNTELRARPLGFRRFLRVYPYSQGGRVRFRVELRHKNQDTMPPIAIFEDIPLAESSQKNRHPLLVSTFSEIASGTKFQYLDIKGSVMSVSGHGRYTIDNPDGKEEIEIVTFDIKRDATMFMWLFPTFLTLVSIILWVLFR